MLQELASPAFRMRYKDSTDSGWCYNWFAIDHVGYDINPRRRDIGYHNIFDHYSYFNKQNHCDDEIHWHFHPMSTYREAHTCATSFLRSPHLLEILCRRVIDRKWFPGCFRAGFHAERPDSHWFLEQWIPFDFSNQAIKYSNLEKSQIDISNGRFGDWRRAPSDWSFYHPSHDDYQALGDCRRIIFRCLNIGTRLRLLDMSEVESAFSRADSGLPTILAFTNHDFRDMRRDIDHIHSMISKTAKKFPGVNWQHSGAKNAAQNVLGYTEKKDMIDLDVTLRWRGKTPYISVCSNMDTFGPQPFLAIKTWDKQYYSDNFDFQEPHRKWTYTLDSQTIPLKAIECIGVASNAHNGSCCVAVVDAEGKLIEKRQYS